MRSLLILFFIDVAIIANTYDFDENKFVFAIGNTFHKVGKITYTKEKVTITYTHPKYKQIVKEDGNISIEGSSGKKYYLKDRALMHTKAFIDIMIRLGEYDELKENKDFNVCKEGEKYVVTFKGEMKRMLPKAEVHTNGMKVKSFKLFMHNGDTLEIVKR